MGTAALNGRYDLYEFVHNRLFNPGGAGVSSHLPLAGGGGGVYRPLPYFRTNRRSEETEAAIESFQQGDSNAILKFS